MRYHIGRDGRQHGPFTEQEIRDQLAQGALFATDSVWHEGLPAWQPIPSVFPEVNNLPPPPPPPGFAAPPLLETPVATGTTGMVLGIVNLFTCILPLVGLPLAIWGLVSSLNARKKGAGGKATAGIVLNLVALVLVVVNAAIGAYLGATGQHPLLNRFR